MKLNVEAHAYYVSITEVNYNSKTKSLELSIKIFVDDFELMMEKMGKKKLNLGDDKERKNANDVLYLYIVEHFKLYNNSIKLPLQFVGKEFEGGAMFVFLEIENVENGNVFTIENTMLFESFEEQVNIIHFTKDGILKTERLEKSNSSAEFNFE